MTDPYEPHPTRPASGPTDPPAAAAEEPRKHGERGVALMLALAALMAATIAARASFLSSQASGTWQSALRQELKLGAAMVEDVRYVYNSEAPLSFTIAAARVRAEEYRARARRAAGDVARALRLEAAAQELTAESLNTAEGAPLAFSGDYDTDLGGFDLGKRLADNRAENPDLVAIDADAIQRDADDRADKAVAMVGATVPVGVAFMFGALAQAFRRRRRALLTLGYVTLAASLALAVAIEVTG